MASRRNFDNLPLDHAERPHNNLTLGIISGVPPFLSDSQKVRYDDLTLRNVFSGRGIDLEDKYDRYLKTFLVGMGWQSMGDLNPRVYPMLVRILFANMEVVHVGNTSYPATYFKGTYMSLTEDVLGEALNISTGGEKIFFTKMEDIEKYIAVPMEDYYGSFCVHRYPIPTALKTADIKPEYRLLKHFLAKTILPRSGKGDEVDTFLGFVIHCCVVERQLSLPYIMQCVMFRCLGSGNKNHCIPYGACWTTILLYFRVQPSFDDVVEPTEKPIDRSAVIQIRGFVARDEGDGGAGPSSGRRRSTSDAPRPTPPASMSTQRSSSMREQQPTLGEVNENVKKLDRKVSKIKKYMKSGFKKIEKTMIALFAGRKPPTHQFSSDSDSTVPQSTDVDTSD